MTFAGSGVYGAASEEHQIEAAGAAQGYPPEEIADAFALYRRVLVRLRAGQAAAAILTDEIHWLGA